MRRPTESAESMSWTYRLAAMRQAAIIAGRSVVRIRSWRQLLPVGRYCLSGGEWRVGSRRQLLPVLPVGSGIGRQTLPASAEIAGWREWRVGSDRQELPLASAEIAGCDEGRSAGGTICRCWRRKLMVSHACKSGEWRAHFMGPLGYRLMLRQGRESLVSGFDSVGGRGLDPIKDSIIKYS